jgi:energy-coupling factor transporter ATP-binding protein EcfA2
MSMLNKPLHSDVPEHYSNDLTTDVHLGGENPFPGLRPFAVDDAHLFFGREGQIEDILLKVSKNRFVTVMGYSGGGKSSLMYCGLVPVLYGGLITDSGSQWNVITTRPGSSPLHSLTDSIVDFMIRTRRIEREDAEIYRAIVNSVLRSGSDGLIEISRFLHRTTGENTFILIDQFEEVFRYREMTENVQGINEAQLYVNLILTATSQTAVPTYVALTMRSDFIGECSVFSGLTQRINSSNYLIPQLTREQKKSVIEGPIMVVRFRSVW